MGPALTRMIRERIQSAWPGLRADLAAFESFLLAKLPDEGPGAAKEQVLESLAIEDLYLAFACSQGDRRALEAFEREMRRDLLAVFDKMHVGRAQRDDVRQQLWEKLFVGPPRPRILEYSGRGRLRFWFRVTILRALLDELRTERRNPTVLDEDLVLGAPAANADPEIALLKSVYRKEAAAAFEQALAGLTPEDRNALRSYYGRGLSIDQIAAAFGIHRATAARRVNGARERLLAETRRHLSEKLSLKSRELDSVFRMIESRLQISVGRLLGA